MIKNRTIPSDAEVREIIESLYDQSFKRDGVEHREPISNVNGKLVEDLNLLGIDINMDYVHSISDTQVGHALDHHSSVKKEEKINQIPVVLDDLFLIPCIVNDYDRVEVSPNKNSRGLITLIYRKRLKGFEIYYLEEVRGRRKSLAMVTMYKKNVTADYSEV